MTSDYDYAIEAMKEVGGTLLYEWEVSKEQWDTCIKYETKRDEKKYISGLIRAILIISVFFIIAHIVVKLIYDSDVILEGLIAIPIAFLLMFIPLIINIIINKCLPKSTQYKFFISDKGIFNGNRFCYLQVFKDPILFFKSNFIFEYICLEYKLFENENKLEIKVSFNENSIYNWGAPIAQEKWVMFIFNDNDKAHIYKVINMWQEAGKIKCSRQYDGFILENYMKELNNGMA